MKFKCLKRMVKLLILIGIIVYYFRYLSFTKYNVRPLKECNRYLSETYYGNFKGEIVDFYKHNGYYIWKLKYIDETGMEVNVFYRHPLEVSEGGLYLFFDNNSGKVRDYFWQKKLQEVYREVYPLSQYAEESDYLSLIKFSFQVEEVSDIEEISDIITTTLIYTKENVKKLSQDVIGYYVMNDDEKSIYSLFIDEEIQRLLEKERTEIFQYIYDEIYNAYRMKYED